MLCQCNALAVTIHNHGGNPHVVHFTDKYGKATVSVCQSRDAAFKSARGLREHLCAVHYISGPNGAMESVRRVLENIKAVLEADGLSMDQIVATTVFLKDLNEFGKMNEVYATFFKSAPPARATVEVARLPRDVKIEISAIAVHP